MLVLLVRIIGQSMLKGCVHSTLSSGNIFVFAFFLRSDLNIQSILLFDNVGGNLIFIMSIEYGDKRIKYS